MISALAVQIKFCADDRSTVTTLELGATKSTLRETVSSLVCPITSRFDLALVVPTPTEPIPDTVKICLSSEIPRVLEEPT